MQMDIQDFLFADYRRRIFKQKKDPLIKGEPIKQITTHITTQRYQTDKVANQNSGRAIN